MKNLIKIWKLFRFSLPADFFLSLIKGEKINGVRKGNNDFFPESISQLNLMKS